MEVPLASLSIHKFVNSVGADAGFAAFIGIALLAILYFAQARETASVRDRLDEAHERIAGLEARIGQLMHLQSTRQPAAAPAPQRVPAPVTPAPASVRPMGSAIASVRRVPSATPGAAAVAAVAGPRLAAPVGLGAPALASATKLIPDPVASDDLHLPAEDTMLVPPATASAASGNGRQTEAATAVNAAAPPRVQIRSGAAAAAGGAAAAGAMGAGAAGAVPGRAAGSPPQVRRIGGTGAAAGASPSPRARSEQRFEAFEPEHRRRFGRRGRLLPVGIVVLALVVIIVGVFVITRNSGSGGTALVHKSSTSASTGTSTSASKGAKHPKAPAFKASSVTVAVLNSTAVGGLAADVGKALGNQGYKQGSITNGATQTQSRTVVYYLPGYKVAAQHVADALKLSSTSVRTASQSATQACATTPTGSTGSCIGDVIVSVGSDRASLASASGSTSAG